MDKLKTLTLTGALLAAAFLKIQLPTLAQSQQDKTATRPVSAAGKKVEPPKTLTPPKTTDPVAITPQKGTTHAAPPKTSTQAPTMSTATTPPAAPVTVIVQQPTPPVNDAGSGWIGILIAGALAFIGLKLAQNKGWTSLTLLNKLGVTLPAPGDTAPSPSRPGNPVASLPPLADLNRLPSPVPSQTPPTTPASGGPTGLILIASTGQAAGKSFRIYNETTIGRDESCAIALTNDPTISRKHATITLTPAGFMVTDHGSSNGTYVNAHKVTGPTPITPGDTLVIGAQPFQTEVTG